MSPDIRSTPRRLLHIFSTFGVGGPQRRAAQVIRRLDASIEHVVLAADGCVDAVDALGLAHRVRVVPGGFIKGRGIGLLNLMLVRRLLAAERPDVLLTYNFGAIEGALAHRLWPRCRHLHFEDGFGPDEAAGRQLARRVWLRRLALSGQSRIVVPSRVLERVACSQWRFAKARVEYLPNGVDGDRFSPDLDRCPDTAEGLTVGTVGVLRPEKNIARLVEAVASLPKTVVAKLIIAGDGPERPRLTALAERLGVAGRVRPRRTRGLPRASPPAVRLVCSQLRHGADALEPARGDGNRSASRRDGRG